MACSDDDFVVPDDDYSDEEDEETEPTPKRKRGRVVKTGAAWWSKHKAARKAEAQLLANQIERVVHSQTNYIEDQIAKRQFDDDNGDEARYKVVPQTPGDVQLFSEFAKHASDEDPIADYIQEYLTAKHKWYLESVSEDIRDDMGECVGTHVSFYVVIGNI